MRDRYEMVGQKSVRFVGVDADTHEAKSEKARSSARYVNVLHVLANSMIDLDTLSGAIFRFPLESP